MMFHFSHWLVRNDRIQTKELPNAQKSPSPVELELSLFFFLNLCGMNRYKPHVVKPEYLRTFFRINVFNRGGLQLHAPHPFH